MMHNIRLHGVGEKECAPQWAIDMQDELFADDIPLPSDVHRWSNVDLRRYLESGGQFDGHSAIQGGATDGLGLNAGLSFAPAARHHSEVERNQNGQTYDSRIGDAGFLHNVEKRAAGGEFGSNKYSYDTGNVKASCLDDARDGMISANAHGGCGDSVNVCSDLGDVAMPSFDWSPEALGRAHATCAALSPPHADRVSRVRLWRDVDGVFGVAGGVVGGSGSWDGCVRIWSAQSAQPLATLTQQSWVYDFVFCDGDAGEGGAEHCGDREAGDAGDGEAEALLRQGAGAQSTAESASVRCARVVSAHTGGWTGEPQQLLKLWQVSRDRADVVRRPNVEQQSAQAHARAHDGTPSVEAPCVHRRGVHALDRRGGVLVSASEDLLAAWRLRRDAMAETARRPCPIAGVATAFQMLADGNTLLLAGQLGHSERGLPVLDLRRGLATVGCLATRARSVLDVEEMEPNRGAGTTVVGATPNRAHLWDLRASEHAVARLPVAHIASLAALETASVAVILAAVGTEVNGYDPRMLPSDCKASRQPPARVLQLSAPGKASLCSIAALDNIVVGGDSEGKVCVWDVHDTKSLAETA